MDTGTHEGIDMPLLPLTPDELLSTTRAVRKRLDLSRPVEREVIEECLRLAQQAPTASNSQNWHFMIVTEPAKRAALAELYRTAWANYRSHVVLGGEATAVITEELATQLRVYSSADYLAEHLHEVPVYVIPCVTGRTDGLPGYRQAGRWGSIMQAAWSFMLAARARGLGTTWTTVHLAFEREAAEILDIPYDDIMQAALIPLAYTLGTDFKPASRAPLDTFVHWDRW
jgi:nitroreductase